MKEIEKDLMNRIENLCVDLHEKFFKDIFNEIAGFIKNEAKTKKIDDEEISRITNCIIMSLASGIASHSISINSEISQRNYEECLSKFVDGLRFTLRTVKH